MFDIKDLYQEVIVDHNRSPRNFRKMENANRSAEGYNPLCGDKLTIFMKIEKGVIEDVSFDGSGCAISVASASLMTQHIKGKTEEEADAVFNKFHEMVMDKSDTTADFESMGKLAALAGVKQYPSRIKCATLCWHTLNAAIKQIGDAVATE
jgi:nitrogen fixation NifU-like protein